MRQFHFVLLCSLFCVALGCGNHSANQAGQPDAGYDEQTAEYARQLTESARQGEVTARQQEEMQRQIELSAKNTDRMQKLIERWEVQADRQDKILERQERSAP